MPALVDAFTTARMTAFRPGASPPPVRTPIFFILGISVGRRSAASGPAEIEYSRWISCGMKQMGTTKTEDNWTAVAECDGGPPAEAHLHRVPVRLRPEAATADSLRVNRERRLVDGAGLEPAASALRTRRSPN